MKDFNDNISILDDLILQRQIENENVMASELARKSSFTQDEFFANGDAMGTYMLNKRIEERNKPEAQLALCTRCREWTFVGGNQEPCCGYEYAKIN